MNKIGYFTLAPESVCYQQGLSHDFYKELKKLEGLPVAQDYIDKMIKLGIVWEKYNSI